MTRGECEYQLSTGLLLELVLFQVNSYKAVNCNGTTRTLVILFMFHTTTIKISIRNIVVIAFTF